MSTLKVALPGEKGEIVVDENLLGKGGEGGVYKVNSHTLSNLPDAEELVVKLYHEPESENRAGKVKAMIMSPPDSDSVAWPLAAVMTSTGKFQGYVMQKLDFDNFRPWSDLAHAQTRRKTAKDFDVFYAITAVRNFAAALESVHEAGHMVGDINESNMFVGTDARVFLVDTDSAQVTDPKTGKVFPCLVGKPEYTAAEISKGSLKNHARTEETDTFGFAVAAYQMITGGAHPADGVFKDPDPDADPPSTIEKIRKGIYPALDNNSAKSHQLATPPRVAISGVPDEIKQSLLKALNPNPSMRPDLNDLMEVFDETSDNLVQCSNVKQHWYDERDGICGWCSHANNVGIDPWAAQQKIPAKNARTSQKSLSGVNFDSKEDNSAPAKRLPPQRAGANNPNSSGNNNGYNSNPNYQQNAFQGNQQQQAPYQQNYSQQGYPQQQQQQQQQAPPQPKEPTQKELKKHFKTSRTVLKYTDGTYAPRDSIGQLLKTDPKLAFSCLRKETPDFATFWWEPTRKLAIPGALFGGYIIALLLSVVWWVNFPQWLSYGAATQEWEWEWMEILWLVFAYVGSIGTILASTWMTISGLWDRFKTKRRYKNLEGFERERWWITSLRYLSISIVYGPILVVGIVFSVLALCVNLVFAVLSSATGENKRY